MVRRASAGSAGALLMAVSCAACTSEPGASPDASVQLTPTERFAGVVSGPAGETGVVDLTLPRPLTPGATPFAVGAAVTGTLFLDAVVGSIQLTGAIDASGAEVRFGGSGSGAIGRFDCTGTVVDGSLRGKCTGADRLTRDFDARGAAGGAVRRFCGTWTDPLGAPAGAFNVLTQGGYAAAVFNSRIISGVAPGSLSGDELSLSIAPIGTVTGRVSGETLDGSWTVPAIGDGRFSGAAGRCPTGAGPSARDAGLATDAAMGTPDAGVDLGDAAVGSSDAGT